MSMADALAFDAGSATREPERPAVSAVYAVGQVLPLRHSPLGSLRGLSGALRQGVPADVAEELRDPRIGPAQWPKVLARELALTLGWAARRSRPSGDGTATCPSAWDGTGRVVVLLPAHGLTVHVIRRALPFALCGVSTSVVGHESDRKRILRILTALSAPLFGLRAGTLAPFTKSAAEAVREASPEDLVVLTGHPSTARKVRGATAATVLGATGGCTVLTGTDTERLRHTGALLREHDRPGSCTRFAGWRTEPGPDRGADGGHVWLREAHPSAVYRLSGSLETPPYEHHGYTVLPCDDHGAVGTLTGFARDPVHHWPGDFLI
ncbi:hypothetical protein G4Z16_04830 [Streptomyces bathyalis]|uniref:Uncharacterized protein n=1 Tax=Streptomyces bathyalis TaxID=2710756 RepID=A0A7T1T3R8_9ACTN|nr:hypothetical protein [Streptomyces bathyalis]QPP05834.1 hypothetical protein G4Z16_04830 [Streptomyces bathyalis]